LIPEINVRDKNWIMTHVRDINRICQQALDDHTISYSLLKANAVVYAYYHDDERDKDIVIGMIYLSCVQMVHLKTLVLRYCH
jgi:hypothetical protein